MIGKKFRGRITACFLAAAMMFGTVSGSMSVKGAESAAAEWQTCTIYDGSNAKAQDYSRWAMPITSYLTGCSDGRLMRVQYGDAIDGILVEYYDDSYQLLDS